ncbi:TPA: hypothetical protein ACGOY9_000540 [Streptococcus suis]|nr:hypothetical protein [Streptococcus suis]HEM6362052.1 hypothetical protein [Streptococcus suis]HEM6401946.1 hypothetical protein [Streptococcus suis]
MGIDNHLKVIKEGVFGRDVRQAIHDGIQQAYDDATANGNANMEVAKARATFETLAERLASMSDKLDDKANAAWVESQLKSILSAGPTGSLASLSEIRSTYPNGSNGIVVALDTGKWYYWDSAGSNWTEGGNYQSRAIGGNEVTADNIDFVQSIQQMLIQKVDGSA